MGIEDGKTFGEGEAAFSHQLPESEEVKPYFSFRSVVKAMLDGTVPFEGAITRIEPKEGGGFTYTVEGRTKEGREVVETLSEEDLKRYNEGELHLWQQ